MDDYIIDGDLAFSSTRSALKFYREQYHKKKEWVGLTDEDKKAIYEQADIEGWHDRPLLEAVEAKLKEKNNAS